MDQKTSRILFDSETILERSRGVFFYQWEELRRLRRAVLESSDPDDIHDLRVVSRRFRAAVELYYPFAPKALKRELLKNARSLTRLLGSIRNIDEAQNFFDLKISPETALQHELVQSLAKLRTQELKRIVRSLKSFEHRRLDRMVREIVAVLNKENITDRNRFSLLAYFSDCSIKMFLAIQQLLVISTDPDHRAARHALRIAIKKWRYFFEIVTQVLQKDYSHVLEQLKGYQSVLGRMNDLYEFEALISNTELSPELKKFAKTTLRQEDALLLEEFRVLLEQKPLSYTFLV